MPRYYTYLISSLPMLHLGVSPPFSYERFLDKCLGAVSQEESFLLSQLSLGSAGDSNRTIIKQWMEFDRMLRNELVKLRAVREKVDPGKYLRPDGYSHAFIYHIALAAYRSPHILEGEKLLDHQRWNFLDQLALGHYFDFDYLIVYAYKLMILERWERINSANKTKLLGETLYFYSS